jgi:hypothetical protein
MFKYQFHSLGQAPIFTITKTSNLSENLCKNSINILVLLIVSTWSGYSRVHGSAPEIICTQGPCDGSSPFQMYPAKYLFIASWII